MSKRKPPVEVDEDAELALRVEWAEARKAFVAAKENRGSAEYRRAKERMSNLRTYWRQVRDAVQGEAPATIPAAAAVNEEG